MSPRKNIDELLDEWPFDPENLGVRLVDDKDGQQVIQMRIDMGILQLETAGRPDGTRPDDHTTYLDYLLALSFQDPEHFELTDEHCGEIDREFVQFYHRRVCWLTLREFEQAMQDADHTLALMDFCHEHADDEQWTMSHEQYRPFVLFHRTQAAALSELDESIADGPTLAIHHINEGLDQFREFFTRHEAEEQMDEDELVQRLVELRESLREQFEVGRTLQEQLADAIAAERYEKAARIRDQLAQQTKGRHPPQL